jgi:biopolymer transport protein ExbB
MLADFNWMEAVGSPVMIVLIMCSIVTFGMAIERALYFWKRHGDADASAAEVMRHINSGATKEAEAACDRTPHPFGAVAKRLFENSRLGESIEERLHVALSQQKLLLEKNLNVLGTMATIAPLLGLLGTVWGIMRAFHDMARVGSAAPSVVAAGVAEALVTTAAGLVIAVPALMLYNHFARRMNVMLTVSENHARSVRTVMAEYAAKTEGTEARAHSHRAASAEPQPSAVR